MRMLFKIGMILSVTCMLLSNTCVGEEEVIDYYGDYPVICYQDGYSPCYEIVGNRVYDYDTYELLFIIEDNKVYIPNLYYHWNSRSHSYIIKGNKVYSVYQSAYPMHTIKGNEIYSRGKDGVAYTIRYPKNWGQSTDPFIPPGHRDSIK